MTITAKVIAKSICPGRNRLITFELEYPRFILSEVNTHRMLSKNSASSRAIPTSRMIELIRQNPAEPVFWGKNQPGMSAAEELSGDDLRAAQESWFTAMEHALCALQDMTDAGLHKQIANRVAEPWCMMKTVMTGTHFANLYHLRRHPAAQPEFKTLCDAMIKAENEFGDMNVLLPGQWHLPYIDVQETARGMRYFAGAEEVDLETAKKVSASCCAQVSYRRLDESVDKALDIYGKLIESDPKHASPVEHQGTPMKMTHQRDLSDWEHGVTHMRRDRSLWSGNFGGWIQLRQTLENEAAW